MRSNLLLIVLVFSLVLSFSSFGSAQVNEYLLDPVDLQVGPSDSIVQVNININTIDTVIAFVVFLYAEGASNPVLDIVLTGDLSDLNPPAFAPPSLVSTFDVRTVNPYGPPDNPLVFVAINYQTSEALIPPANGLYCRMFYKVANPGTLTFRTAVHSLGGETGMFFDGTPVPINWPPAGLVGSFNVTLVGAGTISGTKFNDVNGNCVRDSGEIGLPKWMITLDPGGWATLTDANGDYSFSWLQPNTYTISEVVKTYWEQTCPAPPGTYEVVLDTGQTITGKDFGNRAILNMQDLSVMVAGGRARPGFEKSYGITYENKGTVTTNGTVILTLPPEVSHLESSPGGVYNAGTHSVSWDVGLLVPGFIGWLWTKVQIPNTVPIGTILTSTVSIEPIAGDTTHADNIDTETRTVVGSYDPNEKLVTPEYAILKTDTLRYQINFQNVGTDTAFNIVVRDTLESNLDITALESGASSHPYLFNIVGRELSWTFPNINLPDSNVDEPRSHGFITFKVRPRLDVAFGAEIENRAAIYFDFNPPVITNTMRNRIFMRGDVNSDTKVTVSDVIYLINYLFKGGPAPNSLTVADVNCDGKVTVSDVVYLINYLFKGGPPPC